MARRLVRLVFSFFRWLCRVVLFGSSVVSVGEIPA